MSFLLATAMLLSSGDIYTSYPVFGDKEPGYYSDKRVNTVTDKGLVRELIVQCGRENEGILVHDVIGDVFCDSKDTCHSTLSAAIRGTCRGE